MTRVHLVVQETSSGLKEVSWPSHAPLGYEIGFRSVRITDYFDPFAGTSKERVARKYGVRGVNVHALTS